MSGLERRDPRFDWPEMFSWSNWPEESRAFAERLRSLFERGPWESPLRVEEYAEDDARVVRVELPGIDPDKDVEISVSDGLLHIQAERREEKKEQSKGGYRSEFRYGSFARTLPLPAGVSEQDVRAEYEDGILQVRIPTGGQGPQGRRVPISRR